MNPSIGIVFPTIDRVKQNLSHYGILCFAEVIIIFQGVFLGFLEVGPQSFCDAFRVHGYA
jgi:hypothetical protein